MELHAELHGAQEHDTCVADLEVHLNKVEGEPGRGGGASAAAEKPGSAGVQAGRVGRCTQV